MKLDEMRNLKKMKNWKSMTGRIELKIMGLLFEQFEQNSKNDDRNQNTDRILHPKIIMYSIIENKKRRKIFRKYEFLFVCLWNEF